jgi:hypothetical protein
MTDDDLAIVNERFKHEVENNPSPSITLHIVPAMHSHHSHAVQTLHAPVGQSQMGNGAPPPTYVSASAQLQARTEKRAPRGSTGTASVRGYSVMEPPRTPSRMERPPPQDPLSAATSLGIPNSEKIRARSVRSGRSTRSHRSKWGDDDAEPLGDVKRRQFDDVSHS